MERRSERNRERSLVWNHNQSPSQDQSVSIVDSVRGMVIIMSFA
jgi:hypothetical protein